MQSQRRKQIDPMDFSMFSKSAQILGGLAVAWVVGRGVLGREDRSAVVVIGIRSAWKAWGVWRRGTGKISTAKALGGPYAVSIETIAIPFGARVRLQSLAGTGRKMKYLSGDGRW